VCANRAEHAVTSAVTVSSLRASQNTLVVRKLIGAMIGRGRPLTTHHELFCGVFKMRGKANSEFH